MARLLLEKGADLTRVNSRGKTVLAIAEKTVKEAEEWDGKADEQDKMFLQLVRPKMEISRAEITSAFGAGTQEALDLALPEFAGTGYPFSWF